MKFVTVFLFAALAVASALESESLEAKDAVAEPGFFSKLTRQLSFKFPFIQPITFAALAPIRTTPKPRPAAPPATPAPTTRPTTRATPAPTRPTTRAPTPAATSTSRPIEVSTSTSRPIEVSTSTSRSVEVSTSTSPAQHPPQEPPQEPQGSPAAPESQEPSKKPPPPFVDFPLPIPEKIKKVIDDLYEIDFIRQRMPPKDFLLNLRLPEPLARFITMTADDIQEPYRTMFLALAEHVLNNNGNVGLTDPISFETEGDLPQ